MLNNLRNLCWDQPTGLDPNRAVNFLNFAVLLGLLSFNQIVSADPLNTWTWRNPLPTGNSVRGFAYGNGRFVAVGDAGTILTSTDGLTWTQSLSRTEAPLRAVTFGNGQFVAVGGEQHFLGAPQPSAIVLTSTNGTTWAGNEVPGQGPLRGVVYGGDQFVAVGDTRLMTSADGLNWVVNGAAPEYSVLSALTYGSGQFVVAGRNPGLVLTSRDGLKWIQPYSGAPAESLIAVAYGNGQFLAVGYVNDAPVLLSSINGVDWVHREPSFKGTVFLDRLTFGNGLFMAASSSGGPVLTSPDGVTWSEMQSANVPVAYVGGRFFAANGAILTSTDARTWLGGPPGPLNDLSAVAYGNGRFVAISDSAILTSTNGVNWEQRQLTLSVEQRWLYSVTYGNGQFVAVGQGGVTGEMNMFLTSTDGVNWVQQRLDTAHEWPLAVGYGHSQFVVVSARGGILTSTNGADWVQTYNSDYYLDAISYGNGQFVAVGYELLGNAPGGKYTPIILSSTNASMWARSQARLSATGGVLSGIAYGNGIFVAVGFSYEAAPDIFETHRPAILTSTNGTNWVEQPSGSEPDTLYGVAYGNGQFVSVGLSGHMFTSHDGLHWVQRHSGVEFGLLKAVAYGNGSFVAVGGRGTILQSGSVINLTLTPNPDSGLLRLSLEGPTELMYTLQGSADLISWHTLTNTRSSQPTMGIFDALPIAPRSLFYRAYSE